MPPLDFSDLIPDGGEAGPAQSGLSFDDLIPSDAPQPVAGQTPQTPQADPIDALNALYGSLPPGLAVNPLPKRPEPGIIPSQTQPYYQGTFVRPERGGPETFFPTGYRDPTQSTGGAMVNAFANEAGQGVVSAARGVQAISEAPAAAARAQLGIMDRIDRGERVAMADDPMGYGDMSPEQRKQFRGQYEAALPQQAPASPEWAEQARSAVDQAFPVDSQLGQTALVKSARLAGGFVPLVVSGAIAGLPGAAAMAAAQSYDSTLAEASKSLPPDKAHLAAGANALVQAGLMAIPAARAVAAMPTLVAAPVMNVAGRLAAEASIFMTANQVSRLAENLNARASYDPERPLSDGLGKDIPEQLLVGALVPAFMSSAYNAPRAVRAISRAGEPTAAPELRAGVDALRQDAALANEAQPQTEADTSTSPASEPTPMLAAASMRPAESQAAPGMFDDLIPQAAPELSAPTQALSQSASPIPVPEKYAGLIRDAAARHGVPEQVLAWIGKQESNFNPGAVGIETKSGRARGMFQFMDSTAKEMGVDPMDPASAADGAARYLKQLHDKTGSWEEAVARYGTFSTGQGKGADAAVREKFRQAVGSGTTQIAEKAGSSAIKAAEAEHQAPEPPPPFQVFTGSGLQVDARPEVVDLRSLVASNDIEGRVNPRFPADLQPRDRSSAGSQAQIRDIAANIVPSRLAPSPDAANGAPVVGPDNVVESGNGRTLALATVYRDPALELQAKSYRDWLQQQGHDISGIQEPALISRRVTPLADDLRSQFAREANDRTTLGMTAAEQARTDSIRLNGALDLWRGQDVASADNRDFVRHFMAQLPPAERGQMVTPEGGLSVDGERRIRSAVLARAYGDEMGPTLDRFLNSGDDGMKAVSGALADTAGSWAQMRDEAQRGAIPASLDITKPLSEAVQTLAQARKMGRPISELVNQTDLDRQPMSAEGRTLLRTMFRDDAMTKPVGRKVLAERLNDYADEARRQVAGPGIFGEAPPTPSDIFRATAKKEDGSPAKARLLSARDTERAKDRVEQAHDASSLTPRAQAARQRMYETAQSMMRFFGLPQEVGLRFVDKLVDASTGHAVDAQYTRGLIEFALDTKPELVPQKLMHEITHALMEPDLGLLTDGQRRTLLNAAEGWLAKPGNAKRLSELYGADLASPQGRSLIKEEAVARLAEEALDRGMYAKSPVRALSEKMRNFVTGVGQMLRGRGYRTADDVFSALLRGDKALPGAREQLLAAGAIRPGEVAAEPQAVSASVEREAIPRESAQPAENIQEIAQKPPIENRPGQSVADALAAYGSSPDRYFAKRESDEVHDDAMPKSIMGQRAGSILERARTVRDSIMGGIAPMTIGSERAQAYATKFADALRGIAFRFGQIDKHLSKRFSASEREAMGRAMDAQSVFEQQAQRGETQQSREDFDAGKTGIAGLSTDQRRVVETLDQMARSTWRRMQERGLVPPEAQNLPFYFARQIVMLDEQGNVSRAGGASNTTARTGMNLSTAGPGRREHLTPEETEAAAKAKLGAGATLVRDVRSVVSALARQERAIAGRDLVDAIKRVGDAAGVNLVHEGDLPLFPDLPNGSKYYTIPHPALQRVRQMFERDKDGAPTGNIVKDQDGKPVFERVPVHIADEFKGPLDAVLTKPSPDWYKTYMRIKGGTMSAIMFSPFIHLQVEIGRAAPLMLMDRRTPWGLVRDGSRLKLDPSYMDDAIRHGISPIGQGWVADPTSLMEESLGRKKSVLGQFGDKLDDMQQRLLWDQVFNLQMGLYHQLRSDAVKKGFDPDTAGRMAAHLANRYAGALPPEHLSREANMLANLLLFSRSFTLGNLGVMKDMFNGAPASVRAAIAMESGPAAARSAQVFLRRKAIAAFALDIGMFYATNAVFQSGVQVAQRMGDEGLDGAVASVWKDWLDKAWTSLSHVGSDPMELFGVFPQHHNEPGKRDRIYLGNDSSGRGIYLRTPLGKIGEEFMGWFLWPGTMLRNKLSPAARPVVDTVIGEDGIGRPVYRPNPQTVMQWLGMAGDVAGHFAKSQLPWDAVSGLYNLATGEGRGDRAVQAARVIAPILGLGSVSQGYPAAGDLTGPERGVMMAAKKQSEYDMQQAMPNVAAAVEKGQIDKAKKLLAAAGADQATQNRTVARLQNSSRSAASSRRWFGRNATPEQQQQLQNVTVTRPAQTPAQRGASQAVQFWRQASTTQ